MAPLPDVTGMARTSFTWNDGVATFGSRIFLATFNPGADVGYLNNLATAVHDVYEASINEFVHADYVLKQVECVDLTSAAGNTGRWTGSTPGGSTGTALPSNISMDCDMGILDRYRGGHPLIHLPPTNASNLANPREWSDSMITSVNADLADWLSNTNAIAPGMEAAVVWSVLRGYRPGATPEEVTPYAVQSLTLRQYVGTMRRRARALR